MNDEKLRLLRKSPIAAGQYLLTCLQDFIKVFFYYIYKKDFVFNKYHIEIIQKLENLVLENETSKNLAIALAPRTGKSIMVKMFIAWLYAINKNYNVIYTSYSDKLIMKFSGEIRDIISSDLYNDFFHIKLKPDTSSKALWQIEKGGQLVASPLGGSLTGFGADFIIMDDMLKAANYRSQTERENCIEFYTNTLKSRLDNQKTGRLVLIMQRLHKQDLYGYLQENEKEQWDFIKVPIKDEEGNILFPNITQDYLNTLPPFTYQAQYMQEPITLGGNIIKTEWFRSYEVLPKLKQVYITADTALKVKTSNDYTVLQCWGRTELKYDCDFYLVDQIRGKWESPELLENAYQFFLKWKKLGCSCMFIEDKASGIGLIQQLQRLKIPVRPFTPIKDKYTRLSQVLPKISSGYVYLPKEADWKIDFLMECEAFSGDMSHSHDDIIDCMVIGLSDQSLYFSLKSTL